MRDIRSMGWIGEERLTKLEKVVDAARAVEAVTIILRTEAWPPEQIFLHGSGVPGRIIPAATLRKVNQLADELKEALADLDKEEAGTS